MAACDLLISDIHHTRHGMPSHFLARRGLSLWIDLDQLAEADRQSQFFSVERFNVMSFSEMDYGPNFGQKNQIMPLSDYVRDIASKIIPNLFVAHVRLLTFPRIMGVSFNPLSVYVAQDKHGDDILYLYEVRNTFGDMHSYVGTPTNGASILEARKIFHVSPFFPIAGRYRLLVRHNEKGINIAMRYFIGAKPALTATMRGTLEPMTSLSLWQSLWRSGQWPMRPLLSIHLEAAKLWIKKLKFYKRPEPPSQAWSQARDTMR